MNCYFLDKIETHVNFHDSRKNREQKYFLLHLLFSPLDGLRKKVLIWQSETIPHQKQRNLLPSYSSLLLNILMFLEDYGRQNLLFNICL